MTSPLDTHPSMGRSVSSPSRNSSHSVSEDYWERARKVIPGGGHLSGRPLVDPQTTPLYFNRGSGCRIWDVSGNEYVDYLMAFGAFILGYAHPEVEAAAHEQAKQGRLLSLNHPAHIEFVEILLERFPGADMGTFFRTGSEATTAALRVARRATGRRKVARCGYHGWHDWCLPHESFVPQGLDEQVLEFSANDPASLADIFARHPAQIAAVILAPEMVLPHDAAVFHRLAELTRTHGAAFIMDEVKTGLRVAPNSVSERVGLVPDLITVSKALGNGFAVAALLGRREMMKAGDGMHYSATFHGDTASMAAALKTIQLIDENHVQEHVARLGQRLIDGLNAIARQHDVMARAYGEPLPAMPFLRFQHPDPAVNGRLSDDFYRGVLSRGILLHPRHMWFISFSHSDADITRTLEVCEASMRSAIGNLF